MPLPFTETKSEHRSIQNSWSNGLTVFELPREKRRGIDLRRGKGGRN